MWEETFEEEESRLLHVRLEWDRHYASLGRPVTDEQCRDDPQQTGAKYCKSCRKVIYCGSRLSEDAYVIRGGYYHHIDCSKAD